MMPSTSITPAVTIYAAPQGAPISAQYTITINGQACPVYKSPCDQVNYAYFDIDAAPVEVTVTAKDAGYWEKGAVVRPLSKGITPQINGQSLAFSITKPCQLSVERSWITGNDQDAEVLFIFANPPETYAPKPDDPNVLYYGPGLHHVDGNITLKSGQTLYLAGGALVEAGGVRAQNAQDIAVRGHGVLTCSVDRIWDSGLEFKNCQKLLLADVIVFTYTPEKYQNGIQNMLNVCFDVTVQNYKAIGSNANTDGFQCHGCSRMTFTDSFIRGTDDNLAFYGDSYGRSGIRETNDISVMRCVFWPTWQSGVCRVGWGDYPNPTSANNIRFRDCDVIHMWRSVGNTYTFNERALIDMREFAGRPPSHYSNILFEDIRMEEIDTLISVYTDESKNVTLRNLMLRNIQVLQPFARTQFKGRPGATIFGCNNFENVLFENITIADKPVLSPEQMDMSLYGVAAAQPGKLCFLDANGVNRCPIASFTTDVRAGVAPLTVLFDASGSSVPHGKLASYTWNFGDGTTGSGIKVNHTYQHNGRYEVLLTVMSEAGVPRTAKLRYLTVTDHGVTGEYFLNRTMMDRAIISIDRTLDLNWGKGLPCVELGETDYAMRWSGQLRPRYNEDYTFTLAAGDQARLWVNKQLLAKTESPGGKEQGTIHLQAGHYYDIKLEYREHGGAGFVKVLWASNSQPEEVIPTACLVPWNSRETALALGTKKMIAQELPLGTGFITKFYTAKPQPAKTESWTRMKQAGYEFVPTRDLTVTALGRALGGEWKSSHIIRIWRVLDQREIATTTVWISSRMDAMGARYETLLSPVILKKGEVYRITSTEYAGIDDNYQKGDVQYTDAAEVTRSIRMILYDGYQDIVDAEGAKGSGVPTFYYE